MAAGLAILSPMRDGASGSGEVVQGTIERVTYADPKSLYAVLKLDPETGYEIPKSRTLFQPTRVTAVGKVDAPKEGTRVRLTGRWTEHRTHGLQFEFESFEELPPADRLGLVRYLASSRFPGIGEKTAERIVKTLGEGALEKILAEPKVLSRVPGLKPVQREMLANQLQAEAGLHRANVFLREMGLGPVQSAAVLRKLGLECEQAIREDPFVIASGIAGIGFAIADRVRAAL